MDGSVGAAVLHGLALGGVLAVAGAWSRLARLGSLPHLGVGGVAGVVAVAGLRLSSVSPWLSLTAGVVLGGLVGAGLSLVDRRAARAGAQGWRALPLLPDVAVLAAVVALTLLLRPPTAVALPFGPLGGQPGAGAAVLAASTGVAGALLLGSRLAPVGRVRRWALAGALLALPTVLASGAMSAGPLLLSGIVGTPDAAGLALRAAAVALATRAGVWEAAVAGLVLGTGELVLGALQPGSGLGWLPVVLALVAGVALHERTRRRAAGVPA